MRWIRYSLVLAAVTAVGCNNSKPFIAIGPTQAAPAKAADASSQPPQIISPATAPAEPVATSAMGTVAHVPGLHPKPKPFIAVPAVATDRLPVGGPSTLLLEHAVPESPVPLSDYSKQPTHMVAEFNLRSNLSGAAVQKQMGPPAQIADNDDPWLVYRLCFNQELWLHFTGPSQDHLDAADVVRGAEDGYVRDRVFSADDAGK